MRRGREVFAFMLYKNRIKEFRSSFIAPPLLTKLFNEQLLLRRSVNLFICFSFTGLLIRIARIIRRGKAEEKKTLLFRQFSKGIPICNDQRSFSAFELLTFISFE